MSSKGPGQSSIPHAHVPVGVNLSAKRTPAAGLSGIGLDFRWENPGGRVPVQQVLQGPSSWTGIICCAHHLRAVHNWRAPEDRRNLPL